MQTKNLLLIVLSILLFASIKAQENSAIKISGHVFGDYYWIVLNNNEDLHGKNGFWFRRIYLTLDKEITDNISARLRFDMSSNGDFSTKSLVSPVLKDAYLDWKSDNVQLTLGLSPTPAYNLIEKNWKYRSVEKTISDLQKFVSTRDLGLAVKGKIDPEGSMKYNFMIANGNGDKSESDKGKIIMLSFDFYPIENTSFQIYGDWNDYYGKNDWFTFHVFCGLEFQHINLGAQYVRQIRNIENKNAIIINAVSVFFSISINDDFSFLGRVDRMLDQNPKGNAINYLPFNTTAKSTMLIIGLDYHPVKDISIIPNAEAIIYDKNEIGNKPSIDIIPRLTFYYNL
jgi:hypothetical protein